jgi:hypothetical protein
MVGMDSDRGAARHNLTTAGIQHIAHLGGAIHRQGRDDFHGSKSAALPQGYAVRDPDVFVDQQHFLSRGFAPGFGGWTHLMTAWMKKGVMIICA